VRYIDVEDNVSDRLFPPQVSSLDDIKTSNQAENNAAKTIALDHLGVIAARIQSNILKFKQSGVDGNRPSSASLKPLDDVSCTSLIGTDLIYSQEDLRGYKSQGARQTIGCPPRHSFSFVQTII
jgi:hypothetical protein